MNLLHLPGYLKQVMVRILRPRVVPIFRFFWIVLCFLPHLLMSQTVFLHAGGAYQFHLTGGTTEDSNVPTQFQQSIEYPSVKKFFGDGGSYRFGASYRMWPDTSLAVIAAIEYEGGTVGSRRYDARLILGQELRIRAYGISIGGGGFIDDRQAAFVYLLAGLAVKTYEGSSTASPFQLVEHYGNSVFFRVHAGLDIDPIHSLPFVIGLGATVDLGAVDRGDVDFFYQGAQVGRAVPTGDRTLGDNTISAFAVLKYRFELSRNSR